MSATNLKSDGLSPELRELLGRAKRVEDLDLDALKGAAEALDRDPGFQAELLEGLSVERILEAMEETGETQSQLAHRRGESRQRARRT